MVFRTFTDLCGAIQIDPAMLAIHASRNELTDSADNTESFLLPFGSIPKAVYDVKFINNLCSEK
jgi:hypothetical protein